MPIPITAPPRAPTSRADALRAIDWRTVAAVGLPIWAFVFGVVVARPGAASKLAPEVLAQNEVPTPPATSPALVVAEAPHPWPVVVRHEVIGVPVAVPVLTPAAERVAALPMPPAGDEFRLPASELMPAERCPTFGTKLKFHPGLPEAAEEARLSKKMVLVLHISGHFDDPGFTWNNAQALREGALSDDAVGKFVGDNFEATHQKVGTFKVVGGVKVGGNVASYFCLSDGTVVHAVAGPLDADAFLREARWAVDVRKMAASEAGGDAVKYRAALRRGHLERLKAESGLNVPANTLPRIANGPPPVPTSNQLRTHAGRALNNQAQVHALLAYYPLPKLSQLYAIVFEDVLNEKVSTLPVGTR